MMSNDIYIKCNGFCELGGYKSKWKEYPTVTNYIAHVGHIWMHTLVDKASYLSSYLTAIIDYYIHKFIRA